MHVSHPLIFDATVEDREYQRSISRAAKDRNTLVVLPTALGKTIISALVVADLLHDYRGKRVLVMAPTRPLCVQHMSSFRKVMRLPEEDFVVLTGKTPADFREVTWNGRSRLVFATPEVVRNDLLAKRVDLTGFGLLVFDECHRSVKEYAYTEIASQYAKTSDYPLILGMTASPGSDVEKVRAVCESLSIEHVEYRSDEDPDVRPYIHPISVEWKTVDLPPAYQPIVRLLRDMLDERVRWLRARGHLKGQFVSVTRTQLIELGVELRYSAELTMEEERGPIYGVIARQASALTLYHMLELLETQGAHTLRAFMERMEGDEKRSRSALLNEPAYAEVSRLLGGERIVDHPKVGALALVTGQQIAANPGSRMLVFTQYRDTATHLVEALNSVKGVRAERFVGQATKLGDPGLTQEKQASLIRDLRKGYLNTLVATSIAEEGLDIPEVDLVVFYEPVPSEIRHIQRRGRTGRKTAGKVVILVANGTSDAFYVQASARRVEKMREIAGDLNRLLKPVLRTKERPPPMPMTADEMTKLLPQRPAGEKEGEREDVLASLKTEREGAEEIRRGMVRAAKLVYLRILEVGYTGVSDEELYRELEEEGYPRGIVKLALDRLAKAKHIASSRGVSAVPARSIPGTRRMEIEIEKLVSGHAVAWIDGKWRAKLLPENYEGPRELIKKGSRFEALCSLYDESGVLCVTVRQVVRRA
ncbi:MAG TPA: DEAD/DEAH box helicase [Nitrososphaerales archaeon]|nr:DEAD/DEAH box helicase [Nitrososphaerales archaeon]